MKLFCYQTRLVKIYSDGGENSSDEDPGADLWTLRVTEPFFRVPVLEKRRTPGGSMIHLT